MRGYNKYKKVKTRKKTFNPYIILAIFAVLIIAMSIGYGAYSDTLKISGTANARYTNYIINYELNGGTNPANPVSTFTIPDDFLLPIPTKTNYDFGGWYLYSDFSGTAVVTTSDIDVLTLNPTNDTVLLYAKWSTTTYTITYELDGGTQAQNQITQFSPGQSLTILDPTKTDYTFQGWYDNGSYTGSAITNTSQLSGNTTLYAKWSSNLQQRRPVTQLQEGDHIIYTDANGVDRECVVLYDSTSSYGIQVITTTTVQNFEIGNGTGSTSAVYNVSSNNGKTKYAKAKDSYNNARQNLNTEARKYLNSDLSPANGARVVGSPPDNPDTVNNMITSSQYSYINSEQVQEGDTYYTTDLNQMNKSNINVANISSTYWLGSLYHYLGTTTSLYVRIVRQNSTTVQNSSSGNYANRVVASKSTASSSLSYSYSYGLRPVFTLKSTLYFDEGNSPSDPYVLYLTAQ